MMRKKLQTKHNVPKSYPGLITSQHVLPMSFIKSKQQKSNLPFYTILVLHFKARNKTILKFNGQYSGKQLQTSRYYLKKAAKAFIKRFLITIWKAKIVETYFITLFVHFVTLTKFTAKVY